MIPSVLQAHIEGVYRYLNIPNMNADKVRKLFVIHGTVDHGIFWNGVEFSVANISIADAGGDNYSIFPIIYDRTTKPVHGHVHFYYPIDPRIVEKDVVGANRAWANETNDGWLFAHCDEDHHHDREVSLEDVAISLFQVEINKLQIDANTKLATLIKRPSDSSAASRELAARVKLDNMNSVLIELLSCLKSDTREKYIGYYHQNPDESHVHKEIADCLGQLIGKGTLSQDAKYLSVGAELRSVIARLRDKHSYEYRWDREARLKAEAAKKAAESETETESEGS